MSRTLSDTMAELGPLESASDGSVTFYSTRFGQHYHNRNGALAQAQGVFLEGTETHRATSPRVLEIGFGLGLNFLTTLVDVTRRGVALEYRAFEIDPPPVAALVVMASVHPGAREPIWEALIKAWPQCTPSGPLDIRGPNYHVCIDYTDATSAELPAAWADAIYLDGFSPAVNPELWTPRFLARLAGALRSGGWIATYSAAGSVRRALQAAGLRVERRSGMAGKREWLRAQK